MNRNRAERRLLLSAVALGFIVVASARAADTTKRLDVYVNQCQAWKSVEVVREGYDSDHRLYIGEPNKSDPITRSCFWSYTADRSFSTGSYFSLRLDGERTECHRAATVEVTDKNRNQDEYRTFAKLHFDYKGGREHQTLTVKADPSMTVSYARSVAARWPDSSVRDPEAVPCTERGILPADQTIQNVSFDGEDIYLQLGVRIPIRLPVGLRVNEFRPLLKKNRKVSLKPVNIVTTMMVQRAIDGNLSLNAIDFDYAILKRIGLEKLDLSVK